jgi:hypothetical protein
MEDYILSEQDIIEGLEMVNEINPFPIPGSTRNDPFAKESFLIIESDNEILILL